jgi:hypothetical protein
MAPTVAAASTCVSPAASTAVPCAAAAGSACAAPPKPVSRNVMPAVAAAKGRANSARRAARFLALAAAAGRARATAR